MHTQAFRRRFAGLLAGTLPLAMTGVPALAADPHVVHLVARPFEMALPGATVPMWGFALDADGDLATQGTEVPTVPGPMITVPADATSLEIRLRNDLTEPVSLLVPGQLAPLTPTWVDGNGAVVATGSRPAADFTSRIRSMTAEAAPNGGLATYTWSNLKPGSFLYHSGTLPHKQVPMGLYGAVKKDSGAKEVYPGLVYQSEAVLLFSEIDPVFNKAVTDGTYGTTAYPSAIRYQPAWFLINGQPFPGAQPLVNPGEDPPRGLADGEAVLLRLLNAGLRSHEPMLLGGRMELLAEDGQPYPYRRDQYAMILPAGRTVDALFTPDGTGKYPVVDRGLKLVTGGSAFADGKTQPGGMLAYLDVGTGSTLAAGNDSYTTPEDQPLVVPGPGILGNDGDGTTTLTAKLVQGPSVGSLTLDEADGSFTYQPPANMNGKVSFTYRAFSDGVASNIATVTLDVTPQNDIPVARNDSYSVYTGQTLTVAAPGVLGNDTDVDGDTLFATVVTPPTGAGFILNPSGGFSFGPETTPDTYAFTYVAGDGAATSEPATVSITVTMPPNQPPVAVDDVVSTPRDTAMLIGVLANDRDPDGTLVPSSVRVVSPPNRGGTAVAQTDGTILYTPKRGFKGSEAFTYQVSDAQGAGSEPATVTVNVVAK
ncbi:MAG TPA: Ig-like domain-containing protein [Azospirillaceae bacterium]|nr:Ig-like domain-containing protein [Azospirillaceae bacterium]